MTHMIENGYGAFVLVGPVKIEDGYGAFVLMDPMKKKGRKL